MPAPTSVLVPLTVVTGPEDLLADRAVEEVAAAARADDPDADVREVSATALGVGELAALTSPSLFGGRIVLVVRGVHEAGAEVLAELKAAVAAPPLPTDDLVLVLVHGGGVKGKAVLDAARKAGARWVECARVTRYSDLVAFVRGEVRAAGRSMGEPAARRLIDAVGKDLRELASACRQMVSDTDGAIGEETVRTYYAGRAEVTSFSVADAAIEGRAGDALEQLRWALAVGVAPVLVTSALAQGLRSLAQVASAPRGLRPADLARDLGMPPWKVDRVRQQVRGWNGDGVARALTAVAAADAAVKGATADPAYALEQAVVTVARQRRPS